MPDVGSAIECNAPWQLSLQIGPRRGRLRMGKKALGRRMFLHAAKLGFRHPLTDQEIELASPLPAELEAFVVSVEQNEEREYG